MPPPKKILIVEDEYFLAEILKARLEFSGYQVSIAENGAVALEMIAESRPDIILMDVMMPVLDGYETTVKIRQNPDWADLPIIILTARARQADQDQAFNVGANDYLVKPFETEDLESMIRKWTKS